MGLLGIAEAAPHGDRSATGTTDFSDARDPPEEMSTVNCVPAIKLHPHSNRSPSRATGWPSTRQVMSPVTIEKMP
jgi:hypothetical protein